MVVSSPHDSLARACEDFSAGRLQRNGQEHQDFEARPGKGFKQSRFVSAEHQSWSSQSSHAHPIFARANFASVSDHDYAQILPAIDLATRILTSPKSLQFFHALRFGKTNEAVSVQDGSLRGRFRRRFSAELPCEEADKILVALCELSCCVQFGLGSTLIHAEAYTRCTEQIHTDHVGCRSVICLHSAIPHTIATATLHGLKFQRRAHLAVARLLVHEIAHAFNNACYGDNAEMFFEDEMICEAGLCIENFLWGGQLVVDWAGVFVRALPSSLLWHGQMREGAPYPIAVDHDFGIEHRWRVPDKWVKSLFSEQFWAFNMAKTCGIALRPPRRQCQVWHESLQAYVERLSPLKD